MKAIYKFENDLLNKYNIEPIQDGYNIDDLNEKDREFLSGVLWTLNELNTFKMDEIDNNDENGIIGKIYNEYFVNMLERFDLHLSASIRDLVISCLDNYIIDNDEKV